MNVLNICLWNMEIIYVTKVLNIYKDPLQEAFYDVYCQGNHTTKYKTW